MLAPALNYLIITKKKAALTLISKAKNSFFPVCMTPLQTEFWNIFTLAGAFQKILFQ